MGLGEIIKNFGNTISEKGLQQTSRLFDLVKGDSDSPWLTGGVTQNVMFDNNGLTNSEIFQRDLYTGNFARNHFPIAHTNLMNSLGGLDKVQPYEGAVVFQNRNQLPNITSDGAGINNLMNNMNFPQNSRGVYYTADSMFSKKIADSKVINSYIKNNKAQLMNGGLEKDSINFNFKKGPDTFSGIQHATLYNPHIENGRFKAAVVDWYDFNNRKGSSPLNIPNNWGADMQSKGKLENYANVYYIDKEIPVQTNIFDKIHRQVTPTINSWRHN